MRDADEIEKVHDRLAEILRGEFPITAPEDRYAMAVAMTTLCWVLDHKNGSVFEENMRRIGTKRRTLARA